MSEKRKIIFVGIFSFLFAFLLFFYVSATTVRLVSDRQTIERLGNELENTRANELVLEQRIATAEQTITEAGEFYKNSGDRRLK